MRSRLSQRTGRRMTYEPQRGCERVLASRLATSVRIPVSICHLIGEREQRRGFEAQRPAGLRSSRRCLRWRATASAPPPSAKQFQPGAIVIRAARKAPRTARAAATQPAAGEEANDAIEI